MRYRVHLQRRSAKAPQGWTHYVADHAPGPRCLLEGSAQTCQLVAHLLNANEAPRLVLTLSHDGDPSVGIGGEDVSVHFPVWMRQYLDDHECRDERGRTWRTQLTTVLGGVFGDYLYGVLRADWSDQSSPGEAPEGGGDPPDQGPPGGPGGPF